MMIPTLFHCRLVPVNLTQHLECECGCRIQQHHCSPRQLYRGDQCRCRVTIRDT